MMHDQRLYDRIVARIAKDEATGCWNWTGPGWYRRVHPGNRYGYIAVWNKVTKRPKSIGCHRAMMIAIHGPLTPQQCVCHKCDNVKCCNPEHLFIGTMGDNIRDSRKKGRHYESSLTHCKRGHPLSGDNVRLDKQGSGKTGFRRTCNACEMGRMRVKAGWPEHLAYDMGIRVPNGYRLDFASGEIIPCRRAVHNG